MIQIVKLNKNDDSYKSHPNYQENNPRTVLCDLLVLNDRQFNPMADLYVGKKKGKTEYKTGKPMSLREFQETNSEMLKQLCDLLGEKNLYER